MVKIVLKCYHERSKGFYSCLEYNCPTKFIETQCKYNERWVIVQQIEEINNKIKILKLEKSTAKNRLKKILENI